MIRSFKEVYNEILNDKEIIDLYKKVEENEIATGGWAYHNLDHVLNVVSIVEQILTSLSFDDEFISKAKIACLLHDVGCVDGKENHPSRSYTFAEDYFKRHGIEFAEKDLVLDAIKNHSAGFDTDNMFTLSLILADKLDVKESRITEAGSMVIGNRQFCNIQDIDIRIVDGCFEVNFITNGKIDFDELNEFYFVDKIFKAVESFSKKLNLGYSILVDGNKWVRQPISYAK